MKHVLKILIILLFFLFLISLFEEQIAITTRSIFDAKAIYGQTAVTVWVDTEPPNIIISSPETKVYTDDETIELEHTVSDTISSISSIWYKIDNSTNITITPNQDTTLSALSIGNHTLFIFANDTAGLVNNTELVRFIVGYEEEEEIESSNEGAVNFTDEVISNIISSVNNLPAVSKVNITLYSSETPSNWIGVPTSRLTEVYNHFNIEVNTTTTGEDYQIYFNILSSTLGTTSPNDVRANIYETTWTELPTTVIDSTTNPRQFSATTTHFSRFAIGKIGVATATAAQGVPSTVYQRRPVTPIPIHKPGKFFDAKITIPEKYRTLTQGEKLITEINLINTQRIGLVDVRVDYFIKDLDDNIIYHEYETKAVEKTITYLKEFDTSNLKSGNYMLIIEVKYDLDKAVAGYPITILEKLHIEKPISFISKDFITYIILALLTIVIIIIIYQTIQIKKLSIKKVSEKELAKAGYIKKR